MLEIGPNLFDSRTGIVSDLVIRGRRDALIDGLMVCDAQLGKSEFFCDWKVEPACAGYGLSELAVLGPSAGESVERYCGLLPHGELRKASMIDLERCGEVFVRIDDIVPFSDEQYQTGCIPFRHVGMEDKVLWALGQRVTDGSEVWVPAECVWANLPFACQAFDGAMTPSLQPGLAGGVLREQAIENGMREIIERDSMTIGWVGKRGICKLRVTDRLIGLVHASASVQVTWILFPNDFHIPVVGAIVYDQSNQYLTMGAVCHENAEWAARKAFLEACQLQILLKQYDSEDGYIAKASLSDRSPLACYRRDRKYLDEYNADFSDVVDYGCHLQLYLDPRVQEMFWAQLESASSGTLDIRDVPQDGQSLVSRFTELGMTPIVVDLTTEDVFSEGLCAVRTLVPGCLPNHAASMPYLGSERLKAALVKAGAREPRQLPLPH